MQPLRCDQPLSVDLDHQVSGGQEAKADQCQTSLIPRPVFHHMGTIMFLCQHLGTAPEEGAYVQDIMSDPAYKPSPRF